MIPVRKYSRMQIRKRGLHYRRRFRAWGSGVYSIHVGESS